MQINKSGLPTAGFILCISLFTGQGAVLNVPGDYAGIQQAIDNSMDGDVVLVSPAVYHERIDFKGKAITVTSTNAAEASVVASTVIDAAGQGSVVTFSNRETSASVLTGFTIRGGYGTVNAEFGTNIYWGGGIYCNAASPTIIGNHITRNFGPADSSRLGYGSGIACIDSDALVARNLITGNTGYAGAGVLTYLGKVRVTSNLVNSNSALIASAAAILGTGCFVNNTVAGNTAEMGSIYAVSEDTLRATIAGNIICHAKKGGGLVLETDDTETLVAFNNIWNNTGGNYPGGTDATGLNGNISLDPAFVDAAGSNYRLRDTSPCVNRGDPAFQSADGERDYYGDLRVYAGRVDIGASEYFDNFRPIAEAGPDQQPFVSAFPISIVLDGNASSDPGNAMLSYRWTQVSGPTVTLGGAETAKPWFSAAERGTYIFQLVVNNGSYNSFPDRVQITVKNDPPIADAGPDQIFNEFEIPSISLDGSRSADPENATLTYRWKQISGWKVQLSDPAAVSPTIPYAWPGVYVFELVVHDGMQDSQPDRVSIGIGPNHAPVADAGPSLYVSTGKVTLDGTRSYDPDGYGTLAYAWRQVSGPPVTLIHRNSAHPEMSGYAASVSVQKCVFELVVSDGQMSSYLPSTVTVTIVPYFGNNALTISNPPFNPKRPTIVAFGGGNCSSGGSLTASGVWTQQANWITVDSYGPPYAKYGDMLMVYLSSLAPDYKKAIQTIGSSTGNRPAMEVAWYVNSTYQDPRFAVNRVALLDAVCNNLSSTVAQFHQSPVAGEQCWVDNYISAASGYSKASFIPGALNVECSPSRSHSYPVNKYRSSSLEYDSSGMAAFAYLSLIGKGKNYSLNTSTNKYYFRLNSSEKLVLFNSSYPGQTLAPVNLLGPANGHIMDERGATLSCEPVKNAVRYELLFGFDPDRVMDFSLVSASSDPPTTTLSTVSWDTWWTVRAYDQFGSAIHADPRLIMRPQNRPPVADAGPDLLLFAGVDGTAATLLDGSLSSDPDGDALTCTWVWAIDGKPYLTHVKEPWVQLPSGVHTIQLIVNDGQASSEPDEVTITVVPPLECALKMTPSAVNPRSNGSHILASLRFPDGINASELDGGEPLLIYPAGSGALRRWIDSEAGRLSLFAFFGRNTAIGSSSTESSQLMVVGRLRSGQWFYGIDTVKLIGSK